MSFWAQKLGVPPATPAPTPTVAPQQPQEAPAGPWWSQPAYGHTLATPAPVAPAEQPSRAMQLAESVRHTATCPGCGSGNYRGGYGNEMQRCYDCGYNPRFSQQGGAAGLPSGHGAATPSKQVASGGAGGVSRFSATSLVPPK